MKKLFVKMLSCVLLCLSSLVCYATPQMGDRLIYKGDTITVYPCLLDYFLAKSVNKDLFGKVNKDLLMTSTACWRGYYALFEIRNDSLFLNHVYGRDRQEMDISPLFNKQTNIFVDWYTGVLTNLKNNIVYVHDGWGGYYEYEKDFVIKNGILEKTEVFHNKVKSSEYVGSSKLVDFIKANINYNNVKQTDSRIRVIIRIEGADENGKITKVSVMRGYDKEFDAEAIRVVKSIPQWPFIERRGEIIDFKWIIPVFFEPKQPITSN